MSSDNAAALALLLENSSRVEVRRQLALHRDPIEAFCRTARNPQTSLKRILAACRQHGISLLAHDDPGFPARLKAIPDPPLLLYLAGDSSCLTAPAVAIVGARRASSAGREVAASLAGALARSGFVIVSGLALGIDSAAHAGALTSGRTVAVLGSGLARVQPVTNNRLARRIGENHGLLVSEYPVTSHASPYRFPERNRLISGLSQAVVIVEASEKSGSLITARLALEQGREVLAVPGAPGLPNSRGVNRLLKQGAGLVEDVQDVLDALGYLGAVRAPPLEEPASAALSAQALEILAVFTDTVITVDGVCATLGLPADVAAAVMTELELGGFVSRSGGGYIRRPFA